MGAIGDRSVFDRLVEMLDSESIRVAGAAAAALVGRMHASHFLFEQPERRVSGFVAGKDDLPLFTSLLEHRSIWVRRHAAKAINRWGAESNLGVPLEEFIYEQDPAVREVVSGIVSNKYRMDDLPYLVEFGEKRRINFANILCEEDEKTILEILHIRNCSVPICKSRMMVDLINSKIGRESKRFIIACIHLDPSEYFHDILIDLLFDEDLYIQDAAWALYRILDDHTLKAQFRKRLVEVCTGNLSPITKMMINSIRFKKYFESLPSFPNDYDYSNLLTCAISNESRDKKNLAEKTLSYCATDEIITYLDPIVTDITTRSTLGSSGFISCVKDRVLRHLGAGDYRIHEKISRILGEIGSDKAIPMLIALLHDLPSDLRSEATKGALKNIGSSVVIEAVEPLLIHPRKRIRSAAREILTEDFALGRWREILASGNTKARRLAIGVVAKTKSAQAVEIMGTYVADEDRHVRRTAVAGLRDRPEADAREYLRPCLSSKDSEVREIAERALGLFDERLDISVLTRQVVRGDAAAAQRLFLISQKHRRKIRASWVDTRMHDTLAVLVERLPVNPGCSWLVHRFLAKVHPE